MNDPRTWFSAAAGRRITVEDLGGLIGVSRATATRYLADGLTADHVIAIARGLDINPASALVELGYLTVEEVHEFLDGSGQLVETADDEDLILELSARIVPARRLEEFYEDQLRAREAARAAHLTDPFPGLIAQEAPQVSTPKPLRGIEQSKPAPIQGMGHDDLPAVADSSPDEPEEGTDFD